MASVEFCKIPPVPWPSMASMVAWTSIESIGWIPWKWSPIAPWIPHKLSVESTEFHGKISETGVVQQIACIIRCILSDRV